jgi:adenylate cyclase, class 2
VAAPVHEIEVKYRVDDLQALLLALESAGISLSEPIVQDDQAYAPTGWRFGESKLGLPFPRLRTTGGRHYFTLKQPTENDQANLEYETEVTDRDAMHHAAMLMGFKPTVRIVKSRRQATIDDISLCVDDVEGVGGFLELERLATDDADPGAVQAELAAFAESLGVPATRVSEGYDSIVHAAQNRQ